jgi:hypothetical protein
MAQRTALLLAAAVAMLLVPRLAAVAQTDAEPGTDADRPSVFESLWHSIERAAKKTGRDAADGAAAPAAQPAPKAAPAAGPPSPADARWIGFTPVLVVAEGAEGDTWIAGPFVEAGANGWVTDTVSGLTAPVRVVWREAAPGSLAQLSAAAGEALGLAPGAVVNVAVYLAR